MFKANAAKTPREYLAHLKEPRKSEVNTMHKLIRKTVPKLKPFMQSGMIGYGKYHYKYASGREGDWFVIGLASRKQYISLYINAVKGKKYLTEHYKKQLPAADIGNSCVRIKSLEDVDMRVLTKMFREAAALMKK